MAIYFHNICLYITHIHISKFRKKIIISFPRRNDDNRQHLGKLAGCTVAQKWCNSVLYNLLPQPDTNLFPDDVLWSGFYFIDAEINLITWLKVFPYNCTSYNRACDVKTKYFHMTWTQVRIYGLQQSGRAIK